jgi:catechol 2,3-dioxygenase-like lactoylglutathione lyase family enzyme
MNAGPERVKLTRSVPSDPESTVAIPKSNYNPPFNITRASHSVLHVKDLAKSRAFYVDLIGLIVSDEDKDTIYLRGVAEVCHHSLVLKRANAPQAERVGMRCFTEEDLEKAKSHFEKASLPAQWVERPYQGRTLHVSDPLGLPLEFCATMTTKPRLLTSFEHHHGAAPHRIDHFQVLVPDVQRELEFYTGLGFRLSEYIAPDGSDDPLFVFLQRKAIRTTSCLRPALGRGCITPRSASGNRITSFMSAISPQIWVSPKISSLARGGMGRGWRCSSICATPTVTASNCSTRTISAWTSRTNRCAGMPPSPANGAGSCRRGRCGLRKPAALPASSRASRRTRVIR